ncbi:MAG TPA: hypothetical protein VNL35_18035, partial [Chloroflexota bacterium]|nr:hypothetical protein [Chloroflexota bacterium]
MTSDGKQRDYPVLTAIVLVIGVLTILPILVVNFVFLVADNILALSFLSFLGLGVQPPVPTWGNLL